MKGKIKMIGKRKLGVKLVAVIISMLMVFQILPLTAFANEYQRYLQGGKSHRISLGKNTSKNTY